MTSTKPKPRRQPKPSAPVFLSGGGEMGDRMRALDWSKTALGPVDRWPQSLRTAVSMLLPSKAQIILFWGSEFVSIYNDAYIPVFGAKHPRPLGEPGSVAWSEIWDTQLHELLDSVVKTGEAFHGRDLEFVLERFGFVEETYFDVSYDPVRDESGNVGGVYCIVTETTARVVGERRLSLLKDLAASTAKARSAREACELAMKTFIGKKPVQFALAYLDDKLVATTPDAEQALSVSRPEHVQELAIHGGKLVVGLNPRRPFDQQYAEYLGLVAGQVSSAITNAEAYEAETKRATQLAEIDRAKTAFFSNVSHEFRTPLTLLLGPVSEMLQQRDRPKPDRDALELIERNALRLQKLVNTLLDFSRIEAGRVQARYTATPLGELTEDLASTFRSTVERSGLELRLQCDELPSPAYVDREMWEKIVLNLLSNAFKHTFDGAISVRLRADGANAVLTVGDTGVGIPADQLERVFDRFHQVPASRSRSHEGSGIGLSLVRELVRLHHGTIKAESAIGKGSVFTVRIPLGYAHLPKELLTADAKTDETADVTSQAKSFIREASSWTDWMSDEPAVEVTPESTMLAGARILVADDNVDMRNYLMRLLSSAGARVSLASDGRNALTRLRSTPQDLVISDVMMPGLDGFGLLAEMRAEEHLKAIPFLMLSARAGEESRIGGLAAGADDYLVKPFMARELIARVASQLRVARLRKAAEAANEAKLHLLRTVSHETRQPVHASLGYIDLLSLGIRGPLTDEQASDLENIRRNQTHLLRLLNDILSFAKLEAGALELDNESADAGEIIAQVEPLVGPQFRAKGVEYVVQRPSERAMFRGDRERTVQVCVNLLTNALKATPAGGTVTIACELQAQTIALKVSDTGTGIPSNKLTEIFDPFTQLARARSSGEARGVGLGLSISRQLARAMKGDVTVESTEGTGSTFTFSLPRV